MTVKLGSTDVSKRRVGSGKSSATKTGLNDVRRVVWVVFPPLPQLTINNIIYICLDSNNHPTWLNCSSNGIMLSGFWKPKLHKKPCLMF